MHTSKYKVTLLINSFSTAVSYYIKEPLRTITNTNLTHIHEGKYLH